MNTNNKTLATAIIDAIFANNGVEQIEFKPEYHNGTGYFDPLARTDVGSQIVKTVDENGRRVVVIPSPRQNVLLAERYSNDDLIVIHCHKSDVIAGYDDSAPINHTHSGSVEREDLTAWLTETAEIVGAQV